MQLLISPQGTVHCVYSEAIDLATLGRLAISRGSYVEPDAAGQWLVDLSPVDGPKLGPFVQRSAALKAEMDWLEQHWLSPSLG
ncbi:hypothetical protein F1728_24990 [Gimesia benthica]|uniref:Uncharacterized protein n=1 Tax=Gimesia benthica TaxID=2608982 RepID=A0A6I6AL41_9PLAN|nr:hypothetical protein [Gimesia benthica]QGQ25730.1 hypothetical protein F1728_24990 [Gimesia benthica]|tara:strand:+ start:3910 stop:4158 length:249 start_codon:yes stop_codon:yes gene_type:complete